MCLCTCAKQGQGVGGWGGGGQGGGVRYLSLFSEKYALPVTICLQIPIEDIKKSVEEDLPGLLDIYRSPKKASANKVCNVLCDGIHKSLKSNHMYLNSSFHLVNI